MKTKLCDWIGSVKMNQKTTKQTVKLKRAFRVAGGIATGYPPGILYIKATCLSVCYYLLLFTVCLKLPSFTLFKYPFLV
jgi:hypothetical protein